MSIRGIQFTDHQNLGKGPSRFERAIARLIGAIPEQEVVLQVNMNTETKETIIVIMGLLCAAWVGTSMVGCFVAQNEAFVKGGYCGQNNWVKCDTLKAQNEAERLKAIESWNYLQAKKTEEAANYNAMKAAEFSARPPEKK